MRLSILDQSPIVSGGSAPAAIHASIELARLADRLGYHRYWLAEHHNSSTLADPCPEMLAMRIGAETRRIRIGTGGVLLPYYAPLKVAEVFSMLEALYPGRVDLGIGRAPGTGPRAAQAMAGGAWPTAENFPQQVADLVGFLDRNLPADHPHAKVRANPVGPGAPEIWLLGSSDYSARLAAQLGLRFAFADFIAPDAGAGITRDYRGQFQPSAREARPVAAVGVAVICADTHAAAEAQVKVADLRRLRRARGMEGPIPTLAEALAHDYSPPEYAYVQEQRARLVWGTPEVVRAGLLALQERFQADELIVLTVTADYASRQRSYELLAQACGLEAAA